MAGLYYFILKKLAWNKINIIELISTTNEFTIVVDEQDAALTFNVLKQLNE
jgi:aspartokinase